MSDGYGGTVFRQSEIHSNESVKTGGGTYHKIGSFEIEVAGFYSVYAEKGSEIFITSSSMSLLGIAGDVCCGAVMSIIGVTLFSWGYKKWDTERGMNPEKIRKKFERSHPSAPSSSTVGRIDVSRLSAGALTQPMQQFPTQHVPPPQSTQLPPVSLPASRRDQGPLQQPTKSPQQGQPHYPQPHYPQPQIHQQQYHQGTPPQQSTQQSQIPPPGFPPIPSQPLPANVNWFCPQCANDVDGKFVFCTNCGYRK